MTKALMVRIMAIFNTFRGHIGMTYNRRGGLQLCDITKKQKCLNSSVNKVRVTKVGVEFEFQGSYNTISQGIFQKFRYFGFLGAAV